MGRVTRRKNGLWVADARRSWKDRSSSIARRREVSMRAISERFASTASRSCSERAAAAMRAMEHSSVIRT
jgi:hypothetical protein